MTRTRLTPARLGQLVDQLGTRDLDIVASLNRVRLASFRQLERLHFPNGPPASRARNCRRALARLVEMRVLCRLERRVGGVRAGSAGYVYALDAAGQRLAGGRGPVGGSRLRRPWTPSATFVDHILAVTELWVQLVETERQEALELVDFQAEPSCWRSFLAPVGGAVLLKPDAFVRVGLGNYEDAWFIEVDRATESPATLDRKLTAFRHYWAAGSEQVARGVFPQVLVLVPSPRRRALVVDVIGRQPAEAWALFRVALFDQALCVIAGAGAS